MKLTMDDNMKKNWRETNFSSQENPDRMRDIMEGRRRSSLENLANRYRRFSNISLIMAMVSTIWFYNPLFGDAAPLVAWALIVFFLICSCTDFWFYKGISSIDIAAMPIAEVASKALFYRKRHLQAILVLMPIAFTVIGLMAYYSTGGIFFVYSMIAGGVIGVTIGVRKLMQFMSDYRSLSK